MGKVWKELSKFESLEKNKSSIVFYAENKASMNHFKSIIFELTEKMDLDICYVTSVENDPMLSSYNSKIKSFYVGDGAARTKFFLTLKAKILIMDMPDLEKFHVKRSKTNSVHYIYIFHSMFSTHSYLRQGAIDNYDSIFCVGPHHINEIRATEKFYNLKPKKLVKYGFSRLDTLIQEKKSFQLINKISKNTILIAPSYGNNNLLEICGINLIDILLKANFRVVLRPHFKILKESNNLIQSIKKKFENNSDFILETGVIPSEVFHSSTCMISDWSGISLEYAFTFERMVIFIDVPKKILNSNANDISLEPIEISIRKKIGFVVSPNELDKIPKLLKNIDVNKENNQEIIKGIRSQTVYNIGKSAIIGAEYIKKMNEELS